MQTSPFIDSSKIPWHSGSNEPRTYRQYSHDELYENAIKKLPLIAENLAASLTHMLAFIDTRLEIVIGKYDVMPLLSIEEKIIQLREANAKRNASAEFQTIFERLLSRCLELEKLRQQIINEIYQNPGNNCLDKTLELNYWIMGIIINLDSTIADHHKYYARFKLIGKDIYPSFLRSEVMREGLKKLRSGTEVKAEKSVPVKTQMKP